MVITPVLNGYLVRVNGFKFLATTREQAFDIGLLLVEIVVRGR